MRRILPFLYGVSAVFVALQLFTSWMHSAAVPEPWGWGFVSGPAHVVYFAFTLSCALPAITMAMGSVRGAPSPAERSQLRLIACGMGAPLLIASVTGGVLPILGIQAPRMAATSFAVLGIIIAWSYHRYGFSALAPGSFSREILEILPDGVALISLAGRVLSANGGMARLLGASPDALGGTPIEAALGLRIADLQGEAFERRNVECELTDASGERVPVALSTTLLRDKRELPLGIVLVVRDLREVVSLRNHLVTSGRLAAVGELAAGIAHEINNPMAFVRANLSQLQRGWEELAKRLAPAADDESLRELIAEGEELIQESLEGVERTAAIVQDIKGFAHAGSGSREQVDLNDLLHKVLRVARPQLRYRARVLTRFGEIPPVLGAPQEVQQVFLNLLVNAGQAVEADGTVTVSTRVVDGHVEVEV
ncbi:MAG: PAS domain S-box protein, partial [Proteobacteria bacterium]|nr:PAS domain S-box protein [Pseudomonadota bacterium]